MSPEVVRRKISQLSVYIKDLKTYECIEYDKYLEDHYSVERIIELLVVTATDILFHLFSIEDEPIPGSYAAAFLRASELNWIDRQMAAELAKAAGMRNILVHGYETIDHELVYQSIKKSIRDFSRFAQQISRFVSSLESRK